MAKRTPEHVSDEGRRVTLADVARLAGVSPATASRALNGGPRAPAEELRQRVLDVAERLHYAPDSAAQAVARGHTNVLGLIVHDISDPYFSAVAAAVIRAGEAAGLMTTIADTQRDPKHEVRYLATLRHQKARGVIIAGSRSGPTKEEDELQREIDRFRAQGGRVTFVSEPVLDADAVVARNREGARDLALALCDHGYRDFSILAAPPEIRTSTSRVEGFVEGLAERGIVLPPERIIRGDFTRDGGFEGAAELLVHGPLPECVFAVTDVMAVGAMAAFRAGGLHLPDDVAVAGFDDVTALHDVVPPLTTVRVPLDEVGREAVRHILLGADVPPQRSEVAGHVLIRESTPPRIR